MVFNVIRFSIRKGYSFLFSNVRVVRHSFSYSFSCFFMFVLVWEQRLSGINSFPIEGGPCSRPPSPSSGTSKRLNTLFYLSISFTLSSFFIFCFTFFFYTYTLFFISNRFYLLYLKSVFFY